MRDVGTSTPRPDAPVGVPGRLADASDLQIDGVPPINVRLFEFPHPDSPYRLDGVGEPPTLPSTPAIVNAFRKGIKRLSRQADGTKNRRPVTAPTSPALPDS